MNSIKNAIVTVTLLAVGYGSYIVLSEPPPEQATVSGLSSTPSYPGMEDELPDLSIEQPSATPEIVTPNSRTPQGNQELSLPTASHSRFSSDPVETRPGPAGMRTEPGGLVIADAQPMVPPASLAQTPFNHATAPGEVPSVQITQPAEMNIAAPENPEFPELPPLPELISRAPNTNSQPLSNAHVEAAPMTTSPPTFSAVPSHDANSMSTTDIGGEGQALAPQDLAEANVQPSVADNRGSMAPQGALTTVDSVPPADVTSALGAGTPAFDKSPTYVAAPEEIDIQPTETQQKPEPLLPPIDPNVGPIPPAPSEGSVAFEKSWSQVQDFIRAQELAKALRTLTPWLTDNSLNQEQHDRVSRTLDELAGAVVYSRTSYLEPAYVVRAGETLEEIAAAHGVPLDLLAKINGISAPFALTTGESLKVVRGPFRADVSVSQQQLTLYTGAYYAGRFPIQVGPDLPAEEAFYEVGEKSLGRSYFDRRTGTEVLRGQEDNRYGEHWLGLRGEHITTGHSVGIHGRARKAAADDVGCISLDAINAADLFSILSIGSRVQIRR